MLSALETREITLTLADENDTRQLGQDIAMAISTGGTIWLEGELGAGKSFLARAIIRQICSDENLEIPSPTFSIIQNYDVLKHAQLAQVIHSDLYRLMDANEIDELGITNDEADTLILIEWPERAASLLQPADLRITLENTENDDQRRVHISGSKAWMLALERSLKIRKFLDTGWSSSIARKPLQGDASSRSYEFVSNESETRILMNAPRQADGPPVKNGLPYSAIAHLAEDVSAFVGVGQILSDQGLRTPTLYHSDLEDGLLLLENLGAGQIIDTNRQPVKERYMAAAKMLADFHELEPNAQTTLPDGTVYQVPPYDREAMLIEVNLLADWFAPRFKGDALSKQETDQFVEIWNDLIDQLATSEIRLNLRDFHSPNIIWNDDATGNGNHNDQVGLIDFQDAVLGPSAYDLASLAQDARVDISVELEKALVDHYCDCRQSSQFDEIKFRRDYAIMAAQRATKILGIFIRLDERDNKPDYLKHLPRMQDYIRRSLGHPILASYRQWFERVIEL